jgi:cytochrome c
MHTRMIGTTRRVGARLFAALCGTVLALALAGCDDNPQASASPFDIRGNAQHGKQLIRQFGCGSCHMIPGVENADSLVGPPLISWRRRIYIAGLLRNTPDNLQRWIQHPQQIVPNNAMPNMGITDEQAQDIAAYLYTLR